MVVERRGEGGRSARSAKTGWWETQGGGSISGAFPPELLMCPEGT